MLFSLLDEFFELAFCAIKLEGCGALCELLRCYKPCSTCLLGLKRIAFEGRPLTTSCRVSF